MVRNSFFKDPIKLTSDINQKWIIKGPPRTLKTVIQSLNVFEIISGQPWGYRSTFSEEEKENRNLIGSYLHKRGKIKDYLVTARNYYKALERLGLLYLDKDNKIKFTQAGVLLLKFDNPEVILFEQLVKYISYDFHTSDMELTFNPSLIFFKFANVWYSKLIKNDTNEIVYVSIYELESEIDISLLEKLKDESKFTYFRQFITFMENVSILYYNPKLGYTFLIQKSNAQLFLETVESITTEVISEFNNMKSCTLSEYFENYGTIKYTEKLQPFIIHSEEEINKITGIERKDNQYSYTDIDKVDIKPIKDKLVKISIQDEVSRMQSLGVTTKQITLTRKTVLRELYNQKYVSEREILDNDLWLSEVNDLEIGKLEENILILNKEISYASWDKPAVLTTWDFDNILIWLIWNLNRNPINEKRLCLIPIKTMNLKGLMKNINSSNEIIEILHYYGDLAHRIKNYLSWYNLINEITIKLEILYYEESIATVQFKDRLELLYMKCNSKVLALMEYIYLRLDNLMYIERDKELQLEPITAEFKEYCFKTIMKLYQKLYENGMELKEPMVVPDDDGDVGFHIRTDAIDVVILIENKTNHVIVSADDYSDKLLELKSDENTSIEVIYKWLVQFLA